MNHSPESNPERITARKKLIADWLAAPTSNDLPTQLRQTEAIQQEFLNECAGRLEGPLNQYLAKLPSLSFEDKSQICRFVNSTLARVHLGVLCTKSGVVGSLVADRSPRTGPLGRFQLRVPDSVASIRSVAWSSVRLPQIELGPRVPAVLTENGLRFR